MIVREALIIRLEQLQYLLEISKSRSLTTAAEHLYMTQPALSRAIKALEDELGITLLHRASNGVQLTTDAEAILPIAQNITQQVEHLKQTAQIRSKHNRIFQPVSFSIFTSPAIVDTYLPVILRSYREDYPLADINITLAKTNELIQLTKSPTEHLILLMKSRESFPDIFSQSSLKNKILFTENYSVVVRSDSEIAKRRFIQLKDAIHHKLVLGHNGIDFPEFFYNEIHSKVSLDILLESNNIDVIKEMILTYNALFIASNTLINNSNFSHEFKIVALRNKKQLCQTHICAFHDSEHPTSPFMEAFLEKFQLFL